MPRSTIPDALPRVPDVAAPPAADAETEGTGIGTDGAGRDTDGTGSDAVGIVGSVGSVAVGTVGSVTVGIVGSDTVGSTGTEGEPMDGLGTDAVGSTGTEGDPMEGRGTDAVGSTGTEGEPIDGRGTDAVGSEGTEGEPMEGRGTDAVPLPVPEEEGTGTETDGLFCGLVVEEVGNKKHVLCTRVCRDGLDCDGYSGYAHRQRTTVEEEKPSKDDDETHCANPLGRGLTETHLVHDNYDNALYLQHTATTDTVDSTCPPNFLSIRPPRFPL